MINYVYFVKSTNNLIKIGSTTNVERRLKQLQTGSPGELELLGYIETEDSYALESKLHEEYKTLRVSGEWFNIPVKQVEELIDKYNDSKLINYGVNKNLLNNFNDESVRLLLSKSELTQRDGKCTRENAIKGVYLQSWNNDDHVQVNLIHYRSDSNSFLVHSLGSLTGDIDIRIYTIDEIPNDWQLIWEWA